ncbi:MAG TPA: YciI family protein [Bacteroidia bacterium]|jgi:hypothetical protein|nr:YciI family protein [Bacteroidia bacterium]
MEKFMFLFRGGMTASQNPSPEAMQAQMQKWNKWMEELGKKGVLAGGDALQASGKQVNGTKKVVTDGPFVEAKEVVGGFLIVNAKDINEAVELSKDCPIFHVDGKVEVRPVQKMEM